MELKSLQVVQISFIPAKKKEEVRESIIQSDIDIGGLGGGTGIGWFDEETGSVLRSEEYETDRYEVQHYNQRFFDSGHIFLLSQTGSVTIVFTIAEVNDFIINQFPFGKLNIAGFIRESSAELDTWTDQFLSDQMVFGSSTMYRLVPTDTSPSSPSHMSDIRDFIESTVDVSEFGFHPDSYISYINNSLLSAPKNTREPQKIFSIIDCRENFPDDYLDVGWLKAYITPLVIYIMVYHWQESQCERLDKAEYRLDQIDLSPFSEELEMSAIKQGQSEIETAYLNWVNIYTELVEEQREIEDLLNRIGGGESALKAYEISISVPAHSEVYADTRSLVSRLSSDARQQHDRIEARIDEMSDRYEQITSFIHARIQTKVSDESLKQQHTNHRLQQIVAVVSVLTAVSALIQITSQLSDFSLNVTSFVAIAILFIAISVLIMVAFSQLDHNRKTNHSTQR
jgi:hypothetical protein